MIADDQERPGARQVVEALDGSIEVAQRHVQHRGESRDEDRVAPVERDIELVLDTLAEPVDQREGVMFATVVSAVSTAARVDVAVVPVFDRKRVSS